MAYLGTLVLVYIKDLIYFKECSFQESYIEYQIHTLKLSDQKMNAKGKICLNKKLGQRVRRFVKYLYACK